MQTDSNDFLLKKKKNVLGVGQISLLSIVDIKYAYNHVQTINIPTINRSVIFFQVIISLFVGLYDITTIWLKTKHN